MKKLKWFERMAKLVNKDNETILVIILNIYHPDCFKWGELSKKGYKVFVV